jgi:hypothetical protein
MLYHPAIREDQEPRELRLARLHAASCVMHITKFDTAARDEFRTGGFIRHVVDLLEMEPQLQEKAVWALSNLCTANLPNLLEVAEAGAVPALVQLVDHEALSLSPHRRVLLKGALATIIHLCANAQVVEELLREGILVMVLFHTLVLLKEDVLAPEADLAILTLRFLSSNNKAAQRIIRHMGGAELAICVQEASIQSSAMPDAPVETLYRLELEAGGGGIKNVPPLPEHKQRLLAPQRQVRQFLPNRYEFLPNGCEYLTNGCEFLGNGCEYLGIRCEFLGNGCEFLGNGCEFLGIGCEYLSNGCKILLAGPLGGAMGLSSCGRS